MTLDVFRLSRSAEALVQGLLEARGLLIEPGELLLPTNEPGFVARDLLKASWVWADQEPEPYRPETAVETLIYLISIGTTDDERPAGFAPKSLLAHVIQPGGVGWGGGLMLVVNFRVWCGPLECPSQFFESSARMSMRESWELLDAFVRGLEALANQAVRDVRALSQIPAPAEYMPDLPAQGPLRAHGPGKEIASVWSWFAAAPPKRGDRQWKPKHSAMELARAWTTGGQVAVPDDIRRVLDSHPDTRHFVALDVLPEHVTPLDEYRGEGRNHDLIAIGRAAAGPTLLAIEAKALEPLGPRLFEQLESAAGKSASKIPARLGRLCEMLFGTDPVDPRSGQIEDPALRLLRYQLLTAAAGAAIEAGRHGCVHAVLLINQFAARKADGSFEIPAGSTLDTDFARFVQRLGWNEPFTDATLAGPFAVPAPHPIRLFVAKLTSDFV
jgi:hypothetical protein